MMKICLVATFFFALSVTVAAQSGQPIVKSGGTKKMPRIIEMSNMFANPNGDTCEKSDVYTGTIVKRQFDEDEVFITVITLRDAKDDRHYINIDAEQISLLGRTAPSQLSSLLGKGKKVKVWTQECSGGGSGIFFYADKVRAF